MMGMGKMPPTLNDNKSTLTKMQMMNKMTSLNSNSATNMPSMPPKGPMDPSEMQTKFIIATEAFAAACAPGGSLLIMEKILNEKRDGPELAMANDLMLSLMTKGRERSSSEYQKLLSTHGFTHMKVKHIQGFNYYDVILAKKPF
ncbi:hypothetical protein KUTeg_018215 [Tegillarca granosa]|uniref:O-methyltransferase C-terminal domain-containing protein n=1 Tax=Tegillarca granosa TaxID=220873 RepID=A0ABQ9EM14_TEGGR|nr:hypothetical protein KUTeg_018215 [Tegillarca granosa]